MKILHTEECSARSHERRIAKVDRVASARVSRELLPPFLAALGRRGMSLADAARDIADVPYGAIRRWSVGQSDLPPKYHERVMGWVSE